MPKYIRKVNAEDEINKDNRNADKRKLDYGGSGKTYQSWVENGFGPIPDKLDKKERQFLTKVDLTKGAVRRTVKIIQRLKAPDMNSERHEMKEFIIYREDWEANDWLNRPIETPVRDHEEGRWYRQLSRPVTDDQTHLISGYERSGQEEVHDILFTKANVDKIINSSFASNEESIKFFVAARSGTPSDDKFTYDQFVNLSWTEITNILLTPGGAQAAYIKEIMQAANPQPQQQQVK